MSAPRRGQAGPTLAEVLQRYGADYRATHELSGVKAKVWRAIVDCRTAALGGHIETCDTCGTTRAVYHSCRNRHCPQCQTRAKQAWLAARRRELLPVPYFHLVFTLPHALNRLIALHPKVIYEMLFAAASTTLTDFAANPRWLGGVPSFTLVLHTWKQDLSRHVHVHALVAGGALTRNGEWCEAKRGFLFPVRALSTVYRAKFIDHLKQAWAKKRLPTNEDADSSSWPRLFEQLYQHDWVVYAKAPMGGPCQVLEYLARYTHRVAISNERIISCDDGEVAFRVRKNTDDSRPRTIRLPAATFIERFFLHVLPTGFKRIRHYGLLAPAHKAIQLGRAREALQAPTPDPVVVESVEAFMRRTMQMDRWVCRHCATGTVKVTSMLMPLRGGQSTACSVRAPP